MHRQRNHGLPRLLRCPVSGETQASKAGIEILPARPGSGVLSRQQEPAAGSTPGPRVSVWAAAK